MKSALMPHVLESRSRVLKADHCPFTICCKPSPGPVRLMPTQIFPSAVDARPAIPVAELVSSPCGRYTLCDPGRHRTSALSLPIQILPCPSSISPSTMLTRGTPSATPRHRLEVSTTWQRGSRDATVDWVNQMVPLWSSRMEKTHPIGPG